MIFAIRRTLVLLGAIALGLLAWPDGRGLALGGIAGALLLVRLESSRRYLPPRQLRRRRVSR